MATLYYCFHDYAAVGVCFLGDFYEKRRPTLVVASLIVKITRSWVFKYLPKDGFDPFFYKYLIFVSQILVCYLLMFKGFIVTFFD